MTGQRTLLLTVVEQVHRPGSRMRETRDGIELRLRAEPMGRMGNFETRLEIRPDALAARNGGG